MNDKRVSQREGIVFEVLSYLEENPNHGVKEFRKQQRRKGRTMSNDELTVDTLYQALAEHQLDTDRRFQEGEERMNKMQDTLNRVDGNTEEMVTIFRAAKGFLKIMNWIGTTTRWVALTGAAIASVWAFLHMGGNNK